MRTTVVLKKAVASEDVKTAVERYVDRFEQNQPGPAAPQDEAVINKEYYTLVTDFYLNGWGKLFHFGVRKKGESLQDSLLRHEVFLADKIRLAQGEKCLDLGCGVGGPMMNMAGRTGSYITGINNTTYQIKKAKEFVQEEGLQNKCSFVECNWMHIPLLSGSMDKAYAIEATCHASKKIVDLFKETHRLLKPGGLFGGYDWALTDKFIPGNAKHEAIKKQIELGNGIADLNYIDDVKNALTQAGFEVLECRDVALDSDTEVPWYLPLKGEGFLSLGWMELGMRHVTN
ncbi:MAG: class I SAM-dependent methyltransferase, partial [Bacteroidota bacterium]